MNDSKDDPKLDSVGQANTAEPTKVSVWKQLRKALKRIALAILVLILAYLGIALIGLIPVNRDFVETKDGIEIFVFSGEFHSDLILPIHTDVIAWRTKFETDPSLTPSGYDDWSKIQVSKDLLLDHDY